MLYGGFGCTDPGRILPVHLRQYLERYGIPAEPCVYDAAADTDIPAESALHFEESSKVNGTDPRHLLCVYSGGEHTPFPEGTAG